MCTILTNFTTLSVYKGLCITKSYPQYAQRILNKNEKKSTRPSHTRKNHQVQNIFSISDEYSLSLKRSRWNFFSISSKPVGHTVFHILNHFLSPFMLLILYWKVELVHKQSCISMVTVAEFRSEARVYLDNYFNITSVCPPIGMYIFVIMNMSHFSVSSHYCFWAWIALTPRSKYWVVRGREGGWGRTFWQDIVRAGIEA